MLKKKRVMLIAITFLSCLCILVLRLINIQLISTESYSKHHVNLLEASVSQRMQSVVLDDGRGKFYDRSGSLLNYNQVPALILFPFLKNMNCFYYTKFYVFSLLRFHKFECFSQIYLYK